MDVFRRSLPPVQLCVYIFRPHFLATHTQREISGPSSVVHWKRNEESVSVAPLSKSDPSEKKESMSFPSLFGFALGSGAVYSLASYSATSKDLTMHYLRNARSSAAAGSTRLPSKDESLLDVASLGVAGAVLNSPMRQWNKLLLNVHGKLVESVFTD